MEDKNQIYRIQATLVHKAAQFLGELDRDTKPQIHYDLMDVVFDYRTQQIRMHDSEGNFISQRDF